MLDTKRRLRRAALLGSAATALAGFALGLPSVAMAQEDDVLGLPTATNEGEELEQIVVTGSRLARNPLTAPVPIVQIGAQEIDFRGSVRIEDVVNILPSVFAGQTTELANGATGTASANLRGLGSIRTLVLIDGKRLPFGTANFAPADLNLVPSQLIERFEVVTGGASSVYGSDALAGVVNFITKKDFEGIEVDAQVGVNHNANNRGLFEDVLAASNIDNPDGSFDGREVFATLIMGANSPDGKGNVTAFFSYENLNEITQDERDISACALSPGDGPGDLGCVGSTTFRRFFTPGGDVFQQADGTLVPFAGGPAQTFNFGPFNFFQRPQERFMFKTQGYYEIFEDVELFADLQFMNTVSDAQIAPSGSFFRPFQVNCANPFLDNGLGPDGTGVDTFANLLGCNTPLTDADDNVVTDDEGNPVFPTDVALTFGRRFVEGMPRNSRIDTSTYRTIVGFRGDLLDNVSWETFGQFSRNQLVDISTGDLDFENLQQSLFVVEDENGNPVCRGGSADCVPANFFGRGPNGESLITDEVAEFVQGVGITTGETEQWVVGGTIQGDLGQYGLQSPLAREGIGLLLGGEFRRDELDRVPDKISRIPGGRGLTGVGGGTLPVSGNLEVWELFLETAIPLATGLPLVDSLELTGAYRFSSYTTEGRGVENEFDTNSFNVGLTYSPVDQIRLRGQFQRAIRAPNVIELFTGQNTALFGLSPGANGLFDPCAGDFDPATATPQPARSFEECARTGVTMDEFGNIPDNSAGQFNAVTGGNPNLIEETGDTITAGILLTPEILPGLQIAADYFNIEISDSISTIPPQTTLTRCLDSGDPTFCNLIVRDQFGSLFLDNSNFEGVQATNVNIAELFTEGVDFQVVYDFDLADAGFGEYGSVRFDYVSTWLMALENTPLPGAEPIKCEGLYAGQCGTPNPEYRHRFLTTWQTPWNLTVAATWRYFGSTELDGEPGTPVDAELETRNYLDLALNYQFNENFEFRAGVNNILGADIPVTTSSSPAAGNGNTYPGVFDISRFIFFGVNARF